MSTPENRSAAHCLDLMQNLDHLIRERKPAAAVHAAREAVESGAITVPELHTLVLSPLLALTGARWQSGDEEVWEEHYATAVVRTIVESIHSLVAVLSAEVEPNGRVAVLACPEDEYHDLGLRMLADRLLLAGYRVYFLGAALPLDQLIEAIREFRADTVLLSASTHFHKVQLREYVDRLRAEIPDVRTWVGGPAFAHGHDGWSEDEVPDMNALLGDVEAE